MKKFFLFLTAFCLLILLPFPTLTASAAQTEEKSGTDSASQAAFVPRLTEPSRTNPKDVYYYYSDANVFYASGYGMPNCTAYAWGRAYEILGVRPKLCTGDAQDWYRYNRENNFYAYGSTPRKGAVAVWKNKYIDSGHVAVVEDVTDTTITISNSAWNGTNWYLTFASVTASNPGQSNWDFLGYIYLIESEADRVYDFTESVTTQANSFIAFVNARWEELGDIISEFALGTDSTLGFTPLQTKEFADRYSLIFKPVGYALFLLFFLVSVAEHGFLSFDLLREKGLMQLLLSLLFAKVWIDLSTTVCFLILSVCNETASLINLDFTRNILVAPEIRPQFSRIPVFGVFISLFSAVESAVPILIVGLIILVTAIIIVVKLTVRSFELVCLTLISPVFFALAADLRSRRYFEKFLSSYVNVSLDIVMISVMSLITTKILNGLSASPVIGAGLFRWLPNYYPVCAVVLALAVLTVKPPKILK